MGIVIAGTGAYLPEKVLTNADLEKIYPLASTKSTVI